jgi:hypothetical protein
MSRALLEINSDNQSIIVPLNVEHNAFTRDEAGRPIAALHAGGPTRTELAGQVQQALAAGIT